MGRKNTEQPYFRITKDGLLVGVLFALFVRWCVAAYPYSGYKTPPMYGDYEAQRHWQEITVSIPIREWYNQTAQNDLQYWGLDYPPLTAYHSFFIGLVAQWIDPESVRLFASRGYESDSHKTFMRWTVILSDIYFFFTGVFIICIDVERIKSNDSVNVFKRTDIATIMFLLYPGIILIDHGHFQYNCVSLGFFLWATFFIVCIENEILATIFFILALNYKQMELYHALPFFFYLLRTCFIRYQYSTKMASFFNRFNKLAIAVVSCFIIIWIPFTSSYENLVQVLHRLFPLKRGVFEDKVSNVWCFLNIFIKLKNMYTNEQMAKICLVATATAALPSCMDLFFRCSKRKFVLSLINVSLAFFLFSFQVHEKTILLVAIPVVMHLPQDPFMCFWFLLVSNFSMLPLLIRDGLTIPYFATNLIYIAFYSISLSMNKPGFGFFDIFNAYKVYSALNPKKAQKSTFLNLLSLNFTLSCLGMVWMSVVAVLMKPPSKFPDLFPLLISVFSCLHFVLFFLYFNYKQFGVPKCMPSVQKIKVS